jgi:hypothetical protein
MPRGMADCQHSRCIGSSPCFSMRRWSFSFAPLPKLVFGVAAALAAINLMPGSAQAACAPGTAPSICRVIVNSVEYDVTTFTGSYNSNTNIFANLPAPGVMPWWGSAGVASQFTAAVGTSLGSAINGGFAGPIFAYGKSTNVDGKAYFSGGVNQFNSDPNSTWDVYAQATLVSPPAASAPAPLPLLGAAAACGYSRQLRKRIKSAPGALASSLPLA